MGQFLDSIGIALLSVSDNARSTSVATCMKINTKKSHFATLRAKRAKFTNFDFSHQNSNSR